MDLVVLGQAPREAKLWGKRSATVSGRGGDIVNFPSNQTVTWVLEQLRTAGTRFCFEVLSSDLELMDVDHMLSWQALFSLADRHELCLHVGKSRLAIGGPARSL